MASIAFGGGITNIVGSHAGNTFARNKGGAYMKKKTTGVNPRSSSQLAFRTHVGLLSKHYSYTLSDANRAAWRTFAATNPTVNRLGNTTFLSGQQAFTKFNASLVSFGLSPVNTPPVSTSVSTVTGITCTAVHDPGGSVTIEIVTTGLSGDERVLIWTSPPMNPGKAFISSQLRRINGYWTGDAPQTLTAAYRNTFGSLPTGAGQRIFIRGQVINITNGVVSAFLGTSFLWT